MNESTYNGWTNYETWNWKLWLDNDGSLDYWLERATEIASTVEPSHDWETPEDAAVSELADALKSEAEDQQHNLVGATGPFSDILGSAMNSINWREIAKSILDDIEE